MRKARSEVNTLAAGFRYHDRNSFKYASKRDWAEVAKDIKPVYTAPSEAAALDALTEFSAKWEKRYPAIIRLWGNAWAEFVPFLAFTTR